jgi:probable addiction module antidote protein
MKKYRTHDEYLENSLRDPKEAAIYLNTAIEESDPALFLMALGQVARAHGISRMAKRITLSRIGLYKSLSEKGNPEFRTLLNILEAAGVQLSFKPKMKRAA